MRVLLVEDDSGIGRVLVKALEAEGLMADWHRGGQRVVDALRAGEHALVILDLMLPDIDGVLLARQIRLAGLDVPILMLTARASIEDKLEGFRNGADDYLAKPFHVEELLARVRVLARRATPARDSSILALGALALDTRAREASVGEARLDLTRREFEVLECLLRHVGAALSREAILHHAWGQDSAEVTPNAVDVYVGYLRRKLAATPGAPEIRTLRGVGYRLVSP